METPCLTLTDAAGCEAKKTVKFQCGLLRETETFIGEDLDLLCRDSLLDYSCDMLNNKFPEHPYGDLTDKVVLYVHDSVDGLVPMEAEDPIRDGIIVEIVLRARAKQEYDDVVCPHILVVNTYRTPGTFCDYCGTLLFGLLKQGLRCEGCDKNYHKKCAYRIPNDCTRLKNTDGVSNPPLLINPTEVWSGRPLWIDRTLKCRPQVPHTFFIHTVKKPAQCFHCKKTLKGVFRQVLRCKDCNILVHKRCAKDIGSNCAGEVPSLNRVDSGEWTMATIARHVIANDYSEDSHDTLSSVETGVHTPSTISEDTREDAREDSPLSSCSGQDQMESTLGEGYVVPPPAMGVITEEPGCEDTTSNDGSDHNPAEIVNSTDNIRLQRVTGVSMRHTKPLPASVIKEGWMVHYTNKCNLRKKYYWRLDTKCLTLFKSDTSTSYHAEISLVDILAVDQMVNPEVYPLRPPHVFDIVTQTMTYYVGVDMTAALPKDLRPEEEFDQNSSGNLLGDVSHMSIPQLEDWGVGLNIGITWEEALHGALMPITPQASMGSLADVGIGVGGLARPNSFRKGRGSLRGSFHGNRGSSFRGSVRNRKGSMRGSFRVPKQSPGNGSIPTRTPPNTTAASLKQPKVETKMDISLLYQIFPEELLGSGQFGTVYGGQSRQNGTSVAVKVIDKLRFPHKHESQLRTEVTILQNLHHPGIIHLEQMFETPEKIYVVMEKMNGDMLEMILNSEESKLTERLTKYMIYQILTALQYLHKKDIVHCDLKPENVLLTSETGMPQAKLCDFGFARIIGEKSFRKSIVGTPAYLAPEVLKSEGYNRSLDLWSVGVIVYVSLSGTFPFNEDEEISDQIHNASFMYPPDPWAGISKDAVDLINRLLQVSRKSRFRISQALNHTWLGDKSLWEDLCKLEGSLGMRYVTHESEDNFWMSHGAKPHPLAQAAEAEKKANALNDEEPSSGFKIVTFSQNHEIMSLSSPVSNNGGMFTVKNSAEGGSHDSLDRPDDQDGRSSTSSGGSKKDYVRMTDQDIIKAQDHAKRVGYKVSTV